MDVRGLTILRCIVHNLNFALLAALSFAGLSAAAEAPKLIPCPDCGRSVSRRALMCPGCGCRGEVIEQAAKEAAAKPKPKEPDRMVRADFGKATCEALPVKMDGGGYVVLPLEKVLDIETLVFSFVSTNQTIGYDVPEVALDLPLVRFPIAETNLVFASAETNVWSELSEPHDVKPSDAAGWQAVQPRALKNHGKILLKIRAGEDAKLPPKAHPFYKQLADRWSGKGKSKWCAKRSLAGLVE